MILYFWSLYLEDDWLEACSGLDDASHDDDIVDVIDDSDGVDTVGCPVTLSSSLDSPPADATDCVFYAVDVCNCFSSLSKENSPVMESNVDEILAANLHWKVMESSVFSLVGEAVTICTFVDSDVPDNRAAVEVDTVGCPVALSSSLDYPSANATANVCNTDVCNCFSSLPIENTPVMESDVDKIPANRTAIESSVSNLAGDTVTTPTNMDSDFPVNRAAIELSLTQLSPTCVGNVSRPAVVSDVILTSFGNDSVVGPSTALHDALYSSTR